MTAKRDIILTYTDTSADIASVVRASTVPRQDADSPLQPNEVAVEFLASPVNPQDVLVISGKYPVKPSWEHEGRPIPGYDGVCQVVAVGSSVAGFSEGDRAIPAKHGLGTWRSFAVVDASLLIKVPRELDPVAGSVLKMGGVVAACLLKERERLMPGDWIIQNAGAGVVSCLVAQLAKMRGVRTCSIVRDRRPQGLEGSSSAVTSQGGKDKEAESEQDTETLKLKQRLLQAGADAVVTESELQAAGSSTLACLQGQRVVLGLDSVFGESGTRLVGQLSPGATYINYGSLGGMHSKLCLGQQDVFWKRIAFRNFRLSEWTSGMAPEELRDLLQWLAEEFVSGRLRAPELDVLDLTASALASGLPAGEQQDKTQEKVQELVQQALARSTASSSVGSKKLVLLFTKDASKDKDLASSEGVAAAADGTQGGCLGADGLAIRPGGAAPSS
jgi:trans-2-enoyl-CoA reductase